ncbi:DNA translocase FtsK 4TM domain-containing protein [Actinokineospora sp. HUAS TT18]|uniref:DNA translocase FtsK 4TM domain-containing protein n=1 Tax=Actinokineospora sp. HUAS TT18 TaxID=3447451 RepID=UPI003F51D8C8
MTAPKKKPARKRRTTTTTLGGVVGAAIAGALVGILGSLPWWAWVLLLAVGLGVGYLIHRRSAKPA